MANTKSAIKAARKSQRFAARNKAVKTRLKTLAKKLQKAVAEGKADIAKTVATQYISALDKAAKSNVIHRNAAARQKAHCSKFVFAK